MEVEDDNLRLSLFLAFYNTLSLVNLTYHVSSYNSGDNSIFRYYRYRIAPNPTQVSLPEIFKRKLQRVIEGKKELENSPDFYRILTRSRFIQGDATNMEEIESNSVDYIYTDPPYGAKIPYLDLSTMWNAWLDFNVDENLRQKECIEKGSLNKTTDDYYGLMKKSLKQMYRVLKYNRHLSFVFQHQSPQLWQTIVEYAEEIGFEYMGSIRQSNGQTSFKKRQNPLTVLSGQLIMYFKKVENPKNRVKEFLGDAFDLILNHIEAIIARDDGASLEEIYDELVITGLELGFLHELGTKFESLIPVINENFDYDENDKKYHIKQGAKFRSHNITLENRAKYFIVSFLKKSYRQNRLVSFDDICLDVIPLLKNGITPSNELIKGIFEKIATVRNGHYILTSSWKTLFDGL